MSQVSPSYPALDNEEERQAQLAQFRILDTPSDPAFDEICFTIKEQLDVPIVLLALADRHRHWFKSCIGIGLTEVIRETSLCSHTIASDDPLIVPDATLDPRFATHSFVRGEPYLRFYAGVPLLIRPGLAIGSLCAIDIRPRQITESQITLLRRMSHIAIEQLKHHKLSVELAEELVIRRRRAERIKSQRAQLNRRRRFTEQSARLAGVGGWLYEIKPQNLVWSREVFRILEAEEMRQPQLPQAMAMICDERQRQEAEVMVARAMEIGEGFTVELDIVTAKGNSRRISVTCETETISGKVVRLAGTLRDVTAFHETQKQVQILATTDSLTRLANRSFFLDAFGKAIRTRSSSGTRSAVLLADLDHFKQVNDTLGHSAGDRILKEFAERIRAEVRGSDLVARLGGDEFAVILSNVASLEGTRRVAEKIVMAGSRPFFYGGQTVNLGASVGIRLFEASDGALEELLQEADMALYHAKAKGKNCYAEFEPRMRLRLEAQHRLLNEVRIGLERGDFTLHYLPQFDLKTSNVTGFEALLRWMHAKEGVVGPQRFIEALADPVLSMELSNYALEAAVKQIVAWKREGYLPGFVSVNVAHSQIALKGFAARVKTLLACHDVEPRLLSIEVVEKSMLEHETSTAIAEMEELNEAGVMISLDDFGTGYASLTNLRKFPVRQLKIDRSVTDAIDRDGTSLSVTKSIIELAHTLDMRTVAEGVERQEVAAMLAHCGCDEAQGFLWSGPLRVEDARELMARDSKLAVAKGRRIKVP
jgi:diguanylate cyclase (GGDEF)-like protein